MLTQNILPVNVKNDGYLNGLTGLGGFLVYLDLISACKLWKSFEHHVHARSGRQGWTDSQVCIALILLNLAGGDCVRDIRTLESDDGFCRLFNLAQQRDLRGKGRKKFNRLFRSKTNRSLPAESSVFRYLESFHDEEQEILRRSPEAPKAFIPKPTKALQGLTLVNRDLIHFFAKEKPSSIATIDMDATLIASSNRTANYCYQYFTAYQPLNSWWAEQEVMIFTEFRDGGVNAGFEQLRVFQKSLEQLPNSVKTVRLRSDSAGYQHNLMAYCEKGLDPRFGRIEFAISCPITAAFRETVAEVPDEDWKPLHRIVNGQKQRTGVEFAEVCFVPNAIGKQKYGIEYRYIATREAVRNPTIPGLACQGELPFESVGWDSGQYKIFGIVTNITDWDGEKVIDWLHERCGCSEQAHLVLKNDLAGGKMPSQLFGANAAWWWLAVIAHNLNAIMKQLVLPKELANKRLKGLRFLLINLPARVVSHARQLTLHLSIKHYMADLLINIRRKIAALASCPSG